MEEVRDFAERLREQGIEVILDQLANEEQFNHGGPPEGWERWSYDQVDIADKVLIIGSPRVLQSLREQRTSRQRCWRRD